MLIHTAPLYEIVFFKVYIVLCNLVIGSVVFFYLKLQMKSDRKASKTHFSDESLVYLFSNHFQYNYWKWFDVDVVK